MNSHTLGDPAAANVRASPPDSMGRLLLDPTDVQAASWMTGFFAAHPDGELRCPVAPQPIQPPLDDVPVPAWPYPTAGPVCEAALERACAAGLLERSDGGYRQSGAGRKLFPWMTLFHQRTGERLFERFPEIAIAAHGGRVLECGCGTGAYSVALAAFGPRHLTAMEYGASFLDVTREVMRHSGFAATYAVGSIESLPFADGSFDFVFCRGVLPLVHQGRSMAELARVMAPGAGLLVMVHSPSYYWYRIRQLGPQSARLRYFVLGWLGLLGGLSLRWLGHEPHWRLRSRPFYLSYHSRASFDQLCRRVGLELQRWEPGHKPHAWVVKTK